MNNVTPKLSWFRTRQSLTHLRRRIAVLAAYLGYLAMVSVWYVASTWRSAALFLLVLVCGVVMLAGLGVLLNSWVWHAANETDAHLDERQQQVRNHAYLNSYRGLGSLVVLMAVYGGIAWDNQWWLPATWHQIQAVVWGILLLAMTLPSAVVAWTEPDAPAEL